MAKAEFHKVLNVDRDRLLDVIVQYENYPKFIEGCNSVKIKNKGAQKRVTYFLNIMSQDVQYTLDHTEDRTLGRVEWALVESNFFKQNIGWWELKSLGQGKTDVLYHLEVEFKIPVPGFILNRLVKGSLPSMVKSFEQQACG